jgi:4-hydroxy-2-oxoheptanedioate aldolase
MRAREPLTGLIVKMPAPAQVEIAAHAGFDFVVLDTEHGPGGGIDLDHHIRAADSLSIPTLVRVPSTEAAPISAALDSGAVGVVVPHVADPGAARAAAAAARYPPTGERGLALSTRAGRYGAAALADHLRRAEQETCVVVQVEDRQALLCLSEILSMEGVDCALIGMNDLAMSLGHPGDGSHHEVAAAVDKVLAAAAAADVPLMAVAASAEDADRWRRRGVPMILFVASQLELSAFREAVSHSRGNAPGASQPATMRSHRQPLLLVPGMLCDAVLWEGVIQRLETSCSPRVARIDLDDSIEGMAESILATAPQQFALAGHSLGGIVCLEIMRRAPQRVTRLALLNTSARSATESQLEEWSELAELLDRGDFDLVTARQADNALAAGRRSEPALRKLVDEMGRSVGEAGLRRQLAAQRDRPDSRPVLPGISCPTVVIAGADDAVSPVALQEEIAGSVPGARLVVVAGCGHMSPIEQPERVADCLSSWLSSDASEAREASTESLGAPGRHG